VLPLPIVELDANSHRGTSSQNIQFTTDFIYDLTVKFIQNDDFQSVVEVLQWGLQKAPEINVLGTWLCGVDLLATLKESIDYLERASLPPGLHREILEDLLNKARAEKLHLLRKYIDIATKRRGIVQGWEEERMKRLGCYNSAELKTVIAVFDVLIHTMASNDATDLMVRALSDIPVDTLTTDEHVAVFILATIGDTLEDTDFLANVLLPLVDRNRGTFTWNVISLASRDRTFPLSLEQLIMWFVSDAEFDLVREFFEFAAQAPELLGRALQWSSQIISNLLERIESEKEFVWLCPFLRKWLVLHNPRNPERQLIAKPLVELAIRFGKEQSDGGPRLPFCRLVTARRRNVPKFGAPSSENKSPSFDCLIIIEVTVASLVYWSVGREEAQRLRLTGLTDKLLRSGIYERFEELSVVEQNSCRFVLFGKR
jgi:hypothetical protein